MRRVGHEIPQRVTLLAQRRERRAQPPGQFVGRGLVETGVLERLGGLALGLLVWGIYLRTRLKRLEPRA